MYRVTFVSSLFDPHGADREASHATLGLLLETLTKANEILMRARPCPALYTSGVRYEAEPAGGENWLDCLQVLKRKRADCEDLASYRAAELRMGGVPARPIFKFWQDPRTLAQKYHCMTRYPALSASGAVLAPLHASAVVVAGEYEEDPSKVLGMRGAY